MSRVAAAHRSIRHALFVLAHQDDECIMSTRIAREIASGHAVTCAYLTDGGGKGVPAAVRDEESRAVLSELGIPPAQQRFIGSDERIPDMALVLHLDRAWCALERLARADPVTRIYCLAYEGGHQDHDAAHVLALLLARRYGLLHRTWQVPFYDGRHTQGRLFRVHRAPPSEGRQLVRRLGWIEAARHLALCWRYPSQRITWIGLLPDLVLQRGLRRREILLPVDLERIQERPHPGTLLYERMQGFPYDRFRSAVDRFLAEQDTDDRSLGEHVVSHD